MRLGHRLGFGHGVLAATAVLGAMLLIPADDADTAASPERVAVLSTSPELERFLDNAARVEPDAPTAQEVIAEVAAAPELTPTPDLDLTETASTPPDDQMADLADEPEAIVDEPVLETTTVRTAVNMREGPSTANPTLFVLQPDEKVAILERDGGWARVRRSDGAVGWAYASYLGDAPPRTEPTREASRSEPVRQQRVEAEQRGTQLASLRLRSAPSGMSRVLLTVEPGTPLRVAERRRGWARVVLPDGVSGWIRTN